MEATLLKPKRKITLDELAAMLKRQFDSIDERFNSLEGKMATMATKDDIKYLSSRIDRIDQRLEKIEDIVLNDHRLRIVALEKETGLW